MFVSMSDNDEHTHAYAHPTLNEQHVFCCTPILKFISVLFHVQSDVSALPAFRNLAGMVWIV